MDIKPHTAVGLYSIFILQFGRILSCECTSLLCECNIRIRFSLHTDYCIRIRVNQLKCWMFWHSVYGSADWQLWRIIFYLRAATLKTVLLCSVFIWFITSNLIVIMTLQKELLSKVYCIQQNERVPIILWNLVNTQTYRHFLLAVSSFCQFLDFRCIFCLTRINVYWFGANTQNLLSNELC